ncbi:MAG: TerB family tellurite resistance protein [Sneathiella sp.]
MLSKLKAMFTDNKPALGESGADDIQVATAALLIEAALSDDDFSDVERQAIADVLKRHFSLGDDDVKKVMSEAEEAHEKSNQLLQFTRTVKENFPIENRVEIIEMLWEIAYADGEISNFEAQLARRLCGLIYVDDIESGKARKRVMKKLGITN